MPKFDWGAVPVKQEPVSTAADLPPWNPNEVRAAPESNFLTLLRQIAGTIANSGYANFLDEGLGLASPEMGQRLRDDVKTLEAQRPTASAIASTLGTAANPLNLLMGLTAKPVINAGISTAIGALEGAGAAEGDVGERALGAAGGALTSLPGSIGGAALLSADNAVMSKKLGRKLAKEVGLDPSKIPGGTEIGALRELTRNEGKWTESKLLGLSDSAPAFPETGIDSSILHNAPELKKHIEDMGQRDLASTSAIGDALRKSTEQLKDIGVAQSTAFKEAGERLAVETAAAYKEAGIPSIRHMSPYERSTLALDQRYLMPDPNPEDKLYLYPQKRKNAKGKEITVYPAGARFIKTVKSRVPGMQDYPDNHLLLIEEAYQVANDKSQWNKLFEGKGKASDFNSPEARDVRGMLRTWLDDAAPELNEARTKISINMNRKNALLEGEEYAKSTLANRTERRLPWFMERQKADAPENPYRDQETKNNFFKGYLAHIASAKNFDTEALETLRSNLRDPAFKDELRGLWAGDDQSFQGFLDNAEKLGRARSSNRLVRSYYADPNKSSERSLVTDALAAAAGSVYARINLAHGLAKNFGIISGESMENLAKLIVSPDDKLVKFAVQHMIALEKRDKATALARAMQMGGARGVSQETLSDPFQNGEQE